MRTRFRAVARRELPRFIGRDAELEQFSRLRQSAMEGLGQVVGRWRRSQQITPRLWTGRLHREPEHLLPECGAVWYGKATSYRPVINLLKSYFGISDRDDLKAREAQGDGQTQYARQDIPIDVTGIRGPARRTRD